LNGAAQAGDLFGRSLATGRFNSTAGTDLAIGAPGEAKVSGGARAGAVTIIYGFPTHGLTDVLNQYITNQAVGSNNAGDRFGWSLASANFTGPPHLKYDDLAIGAPTADLLPAGIADAGRVTVLLGSISGITLDGKITLTQNTAGVRDTAETGDQFGFSLAAGEISPGGQDDPVGDLVVGIPREDIGGIIDAGAVQTFFGKSEAPLFENYFHYQGKGVSVGKSEAGDLFGYSVAATVRKTIYGFVAGAPGEDIGSIEDAGAVYTYDLPSDVVVWNQGSGGILGTAETKDWFGTAIALGDFNGDGSLDISITAPGEDILNTKDCGAFHIIYGTKTNGFTSKGDQLIHQDTTSEAGDILDQCEIGDSLGGELELL
jgi:FG-GAP repeat